MTSLAALACVAVFASISQSPPQDKPPLFVLEPGEHSVSVLIQRSGEFLGRAYVLDRSDPQLAVDGPPESRIQTGRRLELDRQACEEVVGKMLLARGVVAVPIDVERGIYEWISLSGPRQGDLRKGVRALPVDEIRARPRVVDYVMASVRLQHANAQVVANNLRQFFADPRGLDHILPIDSRGLVIVGLRPSVAGILGVLQEIDLPDPDAPSLAERVAELEARLLKVEAALREKR